MILMNRWNLAPRDLRWGMSDSAGQRSDALAASVTDVNRAREAPNAGQHFFKKRAAPGAVDGAAKLRALVPVDFSANSAQSLRYGLRLEEA